MKDGYKKLQFDFSDEAVKRLDKLVTQTDSASRAEVLRNSLKLYEYAIRMMNEGYTLNFDKDGKTMTVVPL